VFDSMTEKHTRVFTPCLIRTWSLESRAALVRELTFEINLYSGTRGLNRFAALDLFFERLREHLGEEAWEALAIPDTTPLHQWLRRGGPLSQQALSVTPREPGGILDQALEWSRAVNHGVAKLPPAKPFPAAAEALRRLSRQMEIRVISSANQDALEREWSEAGLADTATLIGGQERGSKTEQLRAAAAVHGADGVMMVGDAAGDRDAALQAGTAFFFIRPGHENESWTGLAGQLLSP
jgi:phosphoglycolate phosphatase-like HAD superfamily hydrolase